MDFNEILNYIDLVYPEIVENNKCEIYDYIYGGWITCKVFTNHQISVINASIKYVKDGNSCELKNILEQIKPKKKKHISECIELTEKNSEQFIYKFKS